MKTKSPAKKKPALTVANLLYRVAGFFLLLLAITNIIFNVISLMKVTYSYGYGFSSISFLFMAFHEMIDDISLRMGLIVVISFFISSIFTFIATEVNRAKLKYLIGGFIAYTIDFLFLLIPFPYQLNERELEFSLIIHVSVLSVLFIIIMIQFLFTHKDNVNAKRSL